MVRNVLLFFAGHESLLLKAVVDYAGDQEAELVEGYPVEPRTHLINVFSPAIGVEASSQVFAILEYVSQGDFLRGA
jgi:hypothetical protein